MTMHHTSDRDYVRTHLMISAAILIALVAVVTLVAWLAARDLGAEPLRRAMLVSTILPLVVAPPVLFLFGLMGLKNHRLTREVTRLAYTDWLTGLANRRAFGDECEKVLSVPATAPQTPVLFLIDIDHFKSVNDRHGHEIGDMALVHIAEQIRLVAGDEPVVARLGGEEFGILLTVRAPRQAEAFAHRLRLKIAQTPLRSDTLQLRLTASIGVCLMEPADGLSTALKRADYALYEAKRTGRNRVIFCRTSERLLAAAS